MRFMDRLAAVLLSLALVLPPAVAPAFGNDLSNSTFSETDSQNNAASPNGWTSGVMLPSQVEPTARAMAGAMKRFYDHIGPTVTSAGSANAQTLTYTVAPAAYVQGDRYSFIVGSGLGNTGAATLNINSLGAVSIKKAAQALIGGELEPGAVADVEYDGSAFQLLSVSAQKGVQSCGAKGDGSTDDTTAINNCTAALAAAGGGTLLFPGTGHCYMGQNLQPGANVRWRGDSMGACLQLKTNATGPLIQTQNAYLYMERTLTGTVTQATSSVPVSDIAGVSSGDSIFVIDSAGAAHTAVVNGTPSAGAIPVNSATWTGSFSAPAGSWWGDASTPGPVNVQLQDMLVDGNMANQAKVNNNVINAQTTGAAGNVPLASTAPTFSPYSNLILEFYSAGNLSGVTFTVTCNMVRDDFTTVALTQTLAGPNNGIVRTTKPCNQVTQIAASAAVSSALTVGAAEGAGAADCAVLYGPMARLKNVIFENCRGWPLRNAFLPGTGFFVAAPNTNNWQTQEAYLENIQALSSHTGCMWFNGPNDSRIKGLTCNFIFGLGAWVDRFAGGATGDHWHISGGFPDGVTQTEPLYGILSLADSFSCIECKSEEAVLANVSMRANNDVFSALKMFHIDDSSNRTGMEIGNTDYNHGSAVKGYRFSGEGTNLGSGIVNFADDGGGGLIDMLGFMSGGYAGRPLYAGTPAACGAPGSVISILDGFAASNDLIKPGPCPSWTPVLNFGGAHTGMTGTFAGEWEGNSGEFRITLTAKGSSTGGATITGFPWGPNQTCAVQVTFGSNLVGLTGQLSGILQGGTIQLQQSASSGTVNLTDAAFANTTSVFGTIGPCVK